MLVRLGPPGTPGFWRDAATGERGDLLELLRRQRGDARMGGAMAEARRFLGGAPAPAQAPPRRRPAAHGRSEAPRRLWAMCRPVDGTAAEAYLRARGIPACRHAALGFHPALVARVTAPDGAFLGVQRIYLDPARLRRRTCPMRRGAWAERTGAPFCSASRGPRRSSSPKRRRSGRVSTRRSRLCRGRPHVRRHRAAARASPRSRPTDSGAVRKRPRASPVRRARTAERPHHHQGVTR